MQEYVLGFAFNGMKTQVALIRKLRPIWQYGKTNGIGGKIEPGESPIEAMVREFKEEAGVEIVDWEEYCEIQGSKFKIYCFRAITFLENLETMEDEQVELWRTDKLHEAGTLPNVPWLVHLAMDHEPEYTVIRYG